MYFQRQARSAIIYEEHDYERKYTDLAYIYSQIAIKNSRRDVGDILSPIKHVIFNTKQDIC